VGQHVQLLSLDLPSRVEVAQLDACRLGKSGLRPKHLALCTIGKNVEDVLATQEIAPALKLVSKLDMRFLAFSAKLCQVRTEGWCPTNDAGSSCTALGLYSYTGTAGVCCMALNQSRPPVRRPDTMVTSTGIKDWVEK
jgi:hypothetical protein